MLFFLLSYFLSVFSISHWLTKCFTVALYSSPTPQRSDFIMQGAGLNQSKEHTYSDPGIGHSCLRVTVDSSKVCHWWDLVLSCHREEGLEAWQARSQDGTAGSERALEREREASCSILLTGCSCHYEVTYFPAHVLLLWSHPQSCREAWAVLY